MHRKNRTVFSKELLGAFILLIAFAILFVYFKDITRFDARDSLILLPVFLFLYSSASLLERRINKRLIYLFCLLLFCELFFRGTLYGRLEFGGNTLFNATETQKEIFLKNKVNLIPFETVRRFLTLPLFSYDAFINLLGNIFILFPVPIALLFARKNKKHSFLFGVLLVFLLSLSAELLQLSFMCGSPDIDDLILNTLGGILGGAVAVIILKTHNKKRGRAF